MRDVQRKLTPKQERALVALLSTGTVRDAAELCKISEASLFRFLQVPEFQRRYREARRQLVETAIAQLQSDCSIAVKTLREIAEDTKAPAGSRVAAARTILEQSINAVEIMDLQERIERLEELLPGVRRA